MSFNKIKTYQHTVLKLKQVLTTTRNVLYKHKWRASLPSTRLSADGLSFFLQKLISMPIHFLNIKYWFISVYIYRLALSS